MLPALRYHKPTRQHYAWDRATKRRVYFGTDPHKARQRYAEWLARNGGPPALPASGLTVNDALEAYRRWARVKYTDRREAGRIDLALRAVSDLYGAQAAVSFKAKALKDVRGRLLTIGARPRSRNYVNKLVRAIQTAWRWLASEELVPAESAASVCIVGALRPGDGGVERRPVLPPADGAVAATLPHCPPMVRAMLQVQLLTGARPGEVCRMRWEEVSREPGQAVPLAGTGRSVSALRCGSTVVWLYAPGGHKTLRRGKACVVPIGPQAQEILTAYLRPAGLVFITRLGRGYRSDSYTRALRRACDRAGVVRWAPNQLRHAAASLVAEVFDPHTAAAMLGHAPGSNATAVYVEQSIVRAAQAAARLG